MPGDSVIGGDITGGAGLVSPVRINDSAMGGHYWLMRLGAATQQECEDEDGGYPHFAGVMATVMRLMLVS